MPFEAPAAPLRPRKTDRTRLRLVEAARDELAASGELTAPRVARRAGSSTATFYNHFPSKDAAFVAVFAAAMDDLVDFVTAQLRIERLLDLGLAAFAEAWVLGCRDFFRANTLVFSAAQARFPASKAIRDVYREREAAAFERFRRFVELGQAARVVREGDADAIGQALMVTAEGWNNPAVARMEGDSGLARELARGVARLLAPEDSSG